MKLRSLLAILCLLMPLSACAYFQQWCVQLIPQFFTSNYQPIKVRYVATLNNGGSWDATLTNPTGVMESTTNVETQATVMVYMVEWFFHSFTAITTINFYNDATNAPLGTLYLYTGTVSTFSTNQDLNSNGMTFTTNGWSGSGVNNCNWTTVQFPYN